MSNNSIFGVIRKQLADNNAKKTAQVLRLMGDYGYPSAVLNWLYKNRVLKIDGQNVKKVKENGHYIYYVPYFDFDQSNKFCDIACDIAENELIKKEKAGYYSNEPVTVKFGKINDKYRAELECPNGGGDFRYESGTEMIDLLDRVSSDFVLKKLYDEYLEISDKYEEYDSFARRYSKYSYEEVDALMKEWEEYNLAKEYEFGEEDKEYEEEGV